MGIIAKRSQATSSSALYSVVNQPTILIVGLGNPGKQYEKTRHNVGFACIDQFANNQDFPDWKESKQFKGLVSNANLNGRNIVLLKPQTFMNISGESVQAVEHYYSVQEQNIIVVHDELDINFGQIRSRLGGSSGGHNGVQSIIQHIGENFARIRIGIGPKSAGQRTEQADSADFVLAKFNKTEQGSIPDITKEVSSMLSEIIFSGLSPETRSVL